jgi:rod shape-determining protein MreD
MPENLLPLRLVVVLAVVVVLQETVAAGITIDGVHPDLVLLLCTVTGMVGGAEQGAVIGFVGGLATDLFLTTPLGLSALSYAIIGYAVGTVREGIIHPTWWLTPVTAAVASGGGVALYALAGAITGQSDMLQYGLARTVVVVAIINAVLALPMLPFVRWALTPPGRRSSGSLSRGVMGR